MTTDPKTSRAAITTVAGLLISLACLGIGVLVVSSLAESSQDFGESDPCQQANQRAALHEAKYKNSMQVVIKYTDMMNITDELRVGEISVEDFAVEERDIINEMEALNGIKAEIDKQLLELE